MPSPSWEVSDRNYASPRADGGIDVYCDTPAELAERMASLAGVGPGVRVLEPSAGRGAIARVLLGLGAEVRCLECDSGLVEGLRRQGFEAEERNFLSTPPDPTYDAVVMNPPFGGTRPGCHLRHALRFLRPGGRVVSTLDPYTVQNVTFRLWTEGGNLARVQDPSPSVDIAVERDFWVEDEGSYGPAFGVLFGPEDLPEETFCALGTNVPACLVGLRREG